MKLRLYHLREEYADRGKNFETWIPRHSRPMIRSSEIESNSCVKLEHLLQILNEKFDSFPSIFKSSNKITCHCHGLGCEDWGVRDRYAARNTYVRILLLWSIAIGRPISKAALRFESKH